ncbi:hypothetical protein TNCV_2464911 [Trichonephila clavipes]|uniref:Uncharacterized protein n=1 Tax=Trichonephila clavipes TaxID=2585209 RepID=A0A8X6UTY9_TRICX|nr:hypothetical protein TNCV_2464911 [Trichonephila clavipes]
MSLPSTYKPHSVTDLLENFVMLFTSKVMSFMAFLAIDVAAPKSFLSQGLYAAFVTQGIEIKVYTPITFQEQEDRKSLMVMIVNSWPQCGMSLIPSVTEDLPCRGADAH